MLPLRTVPLKTPDWSRGQRQHIVRRKIFMLLSLLVVGLPMVASAALTNYFWNGSAPGNAKWSRSQNWNATNTAPPANSIGGLTNTAITFEGVLKLAPVMDNSSFIHSLIFGSTAGAFTLSSQGSEVLTLGAGGIANFSPNRQTVTSSLNLSNAQTWNAIAGGLAILGAVYLGANALTVAGAWDVAISNVIQGSGAMFKQGAGTLTFAGNGANTYSGGTSLDGGTITVAKTNALGTGPLTINAGSLNIGGFNQTVGTVSLSGGTISGTSGLLKGSAYQVQSGTVSAQLGGTGALTKSGNGVVTLSASNSFSGGTVINGGTLAVNNLVGSGTGSGNVSINNGAMLVGSGRISGAVTNRSGGVISAGAGVGSLATGAEFWLGGSTNRLEIRDAVAAAGVGWDVLNITGALNVSATASNKVFIDVVGLTPAGLPGAVGNFDPTQNYVWTIVQTSDGIFYPPGESELTVYELVTGQFVNAAAGGSFSVGTANNGKNLTLSYVVPEPERWMFLVIGICGYLYGRKWSR